MCVHLGTGECPGDCHIKQAQIFLDMKLMSGMFYEFSLLYLLRQGLTHYVTLATWKLACRPD